MLMTKMEGAEANPDKGFVTTVLPFSSKADIERRLLAATCPLIGIEAPQGLVQSSLVVAATHLQREMLKRGRIADIAIGHEYARARFEAENRFTHIIFLDGRACRDFAALNVFDQMILSGGEQSGLYDPSAGGRFLGWIASRSAYLKQPHFI